jgi:hypothetical protein
MGSTYLTALTAFTAALIETLATIYLPREQIHFKGVISDVYEKYDREDL